MTAYIMDFLNGKGSYFEHPEDDEIRDADSVECLTFKKSEEVKEKLKGYLIEMTFDKFRDSYPLRLDAKSHDLNKIKDELKLCEEKLEKHSNAGKIKNWYNPLKKRSFIKYTEDEYSGKHVNRKIGFINRIMSLTPWIGGSVITKSILKDEPIILPFFSSLILLGTSEMCRGIHNNADNYEKAIKENSAWLNFGKGIESEEIPINIVQSEEAMELADKIRDYEYLKVDWSKVNSKLEEIYKDYIS